MSGNLELLNELCGDPAGMIAACRESDAAHMEFKVSDKRDRVTALALATIEPELAERLLQVVEEWDAGG